MVEAEAEAKSTAGEDGDLDLERVAEPLIGGRIGYEQFEEGVRGVVEVVEGLEGAVG